MKLNSFKTWKANIVSAKVSFCGYKNFRLLKLPLTKCLKLTTNMPKAGFKQPLIYYKSRMQEE